MDAPEDEDLPAFEVFEVSYGGGPRFKRFIHPKGRYVKPFFLCASIHPVSCHDEIGSDVHVVGGSSIVRVHADGSHSYWRPDKADDATEAR